MILRFLGVLLIAATLAACQKQTKMVYVLEEPQSVALTASASAQSVRMGEAVVLHAQRTTTGKWKQVPLESVTRGQCWVYQPPVESGLEVADAIEWDVYPDGAVLFRAEYRMDHTRVVTTDMQGTIKLTPRSTVKCEPDRVVEGAPIQIEVL
jgi:hypothetical protein